MPKYGVTISVSDFYYEVEAVDENDAMEQAFIFAEDALKDAGVGIDLDCNEVIVIDE